MILKDILEKNTLSVEGQKPVTIVSNVVANGTGFETSLFIEPLGVDREVEGTAKMAYLWVQGWRRQLGAAGDIVEHCRSDFDLYEHMDK